jgi:2,4-dienoyl-CoA reductase (NADPH2)
MGRRPAGEDRRRPGAAARRRAGARSHLLQRKASKVGRGTGQDLGLGAPRHAAAQGRDDAGRRQYEKIDDAGLHITVGGESRVLEVDNVIVCAGQESPGRADAGGRRDAGAALPQDRRAALAGELDAKRAIREGAELAARL